MKNIRNIALAILISIFSSSYALAEFTVGVSGAIANIEASGTETEGNEKTSKSLNHITPVGSIFVEYNDVMGSGITLGVDYIPVTADVADGVQKRTDTELSVTGDNDHTSTTRNQKAQAEMNDHFTFYAAFNVTDDVYLKAGYVTVDLETTESLDTGSKYGNETMDGILIGVGFESEMGNSMIGRVELSHTSYEEMTFKSSTARTGVGVNNVIDADIDITQVKASLGYKF